MAVIAELTLRGITTDQYDAVRERTGWLDRSPDGGLAHLTWWEGADCHNADAWESEAAFGAFGEQRLGPALAALGIDAEPEVSFHPAHEVYTVGRATVGPTVPESTGNAARVRRGYASFAAGDMPAVLGLMAEGIVWSTPAGVSFGGVYHGPQGAGEFFAKLPQNFAELNVQPETFLDAGDTVVVQGHHRGRTVTGNAFQVPFVHIWTWHDGRATGFTELMDSATLARALGEAIPVRTPAGAGAPE